MNKNISYRSKLVSFILLIFLCQFSTFASASASCSFSVTPINFGDLTTNQGPNWHSSTNGSVTASCMASEPGQVFVCQANMGTVAPNGLQQPMTSGSTQLSYKLAKSFWGGDNWGWGQDMSSVEFSVSLGNNTTSFPITATTIQDQDKLPLGDYFVNNTGLSSLIYYAYSANGEDRESACGHAIQTSADFTVSASVKPYCSVILTTPLNFQTVGLNSTAQSTFSIFLNCSYNVPYTIALEDLGNIGSQNMKTMSLVSDPSKSIYYDVYQTDSLSKSWGNGQDGTSLHYATGSGETQIVTGYGRIPYQFFPALGLYTGTLNVVITY